MLFWSKNEPAEPKKLTHEVKELADQVEKLERTVKSLKLEWEESYDKLHHLMARVTKRQQTAARERDEGQTIVQDAPGSDFHSPPRVGLPPVGTHGRLQAMRAKFNGVLPR